jgi:hypothetical protein
MEFPKSESKAEELEVHPEADGMIVDFDLDPALRLSFAVLNILSRLS